MKKILAILLAALMVIPIFAVQLHAAEATYATEDQHIPAGKVDVLKDAKSVRASKDKSKQYDNGKVQTIFTDGIVNATTDTSTYSTYMVSATGTAAQTVPGVSQKYFYTYTFHGLEKAAIDTVALFYGSTKKDLLNLDQVDSVVDIYYSTNSGTSYQLAKSITLTTGTVDDVSAASILQIGSQNGVFYRYAIVPLDSQIDNVTNFIFAVKAKKLHSSAAHYTSRLSEISAYGPADANAHTPEMTALSFDSIVLNGNKNFGKGDGSASDKLDTVNRIVSTDTLTSDIVLNGWLGANQKVDAIGYRLNGVDTFNDSFFKDPEKAVILAGGSFATRFAITIPKNNLNGEYSIVAIAKIGNQIVELKNDEIDTSFTFRRVPTATERSNAKTALTAAAEASSLANADSILAHALAEIDAAVTLADVEAVQAKYIANEALVDAELPHVDANDDRTCDICEEDLIEYTAVNLTLNSDIITNFYMDMPAAAAEAGSMKFTVGGRTVEGVKAQYSETAGYYFFPCPVNVLEMATDIRAVFTYDGKDYEKTYSVKDYVAEIVNGDYSAETKTLAKKLANYGAYTQNYLADIRENVTIGDEGYAAMTKYDDADIDTAAALAAVTDSFADPTESAEGISLFGRTVKFDASIALNYYVEVASGEEPAVSCTGKTCTAAAYAGKDNVYIVTVKDIKATELATDFTVTVNGVAFTGSVLDYCGKVMAAHTAGTDSDALVINAMTAFYEYYAAANAFSGAQ